MNHRYPGTSFSDHIFRYHDNPDVKMIVLLGEVRKYAHKILHLPTQLVTKSPNNFISIIFYEICCM